MMNKTMNKTLLAAALFAAGMMTSAQAAPTRTFDIQVQSVDPAGNVLVVSSFPDSGKRWKVALTPGTDLRMDRELPRGELPLGKMVWVKGSLREKGEGPKWRPFQERSLVLQQIHIPSTTGGRIPQGMIEAVFEKRDGKLVAMVAGAEAACLRGGRDDFRHPVVWSLDEPMTRETIEPGHTGELTAEETSDGLVAKKLHLKVQHKPYGTYMVETDIRDHGEIEPVAEIRKSVAAIEEAHAGIAGRLDELAPVDMRLEPALLRQGETPTLTVRALSDRRPAAGVVVHENHFNAGMGEGTRLALDWQEGRDEKGRTIFTASLELPAARLGQHLVHWTCDIGGDIDDYWRSYAVVDGDSSVALFNDCSLEGEDDRKALLAHHIPHTYWMGRALAFPMLGKFKTAAQWADLSRAAREHGCEPQLFLFQSSWARKLGHLNFDGDNEDYIREVLRAYKRIWPLYRYPVDCDNAGTYAYSTAFTRAMLKEGFESKISVCPFHTLEHHPGQLINTTVIGHLPHYISTEDFRKTGNETGRNLVSISQTYGNYLRIRSGAECWECTEPIWLTLEWNNQAGPRGDYGPAYFSRMYHQTDALLANSRNNPGHPFFYIAGLEASVLANRWARPGHDLLIADLVARAKADPRIVFATGNAITGYLRRHHKTSPRNIRYYHDYLAGVSQKGSPLELPDSIDVEDKDFRAVFGKPEAIPVFHHDFTKKWDEPDFGNEGAIRPYWWKKQAGAGLASRFDLTPKPEDWRDLKITRNDTPGKTHRVTLTVESPRAAERVPLAIWDIPREWQPGTDWFKTKNVREFIPVVAPQTDNLNGVLVVDLKKGANTFSVEIATPERELQTMDTTFADCVRAKTWTSGTHDGRPVTYLWPQNPWGAKIELTLPAGKSVTAYLTPAKEEQELSGGTHSFDLRFNNWLRLTGLTREEVEQGVRVK